MRKPKYLEIKLATNPKSGALRVWVKRRDKQRELVHGKDFTVKDSVLRFTPKLSVGRNEYIVFRT